MLLTMWELLIFLTHAADSVRVVNRLDPCCS